jgi:hypothetical protein
MPTKTLDSKGQQTAVLKSRLIFSDLLELAMEPTGGSTHDQARAPGGVSVGTPIGPSNQFTDICQEPQLAEMGRAK